MVAPVLRGALVTGLALLLVGCVSTVSPALISSAARAARTSDAATVLCNLDLLLWSHSFGPRADTRECVDILGSVSIAN
jgi:hypothetical protein